MDNLLDLVERHARSAPRKIALSRWISGDGFVETSYAQLLRRAHRLAGRLAALAPPQTILPMLVGKSAEGIACMLAAVGLGRPFCFISTKYRAPQIAAVLDATASPVCIADSAGLVALRRAAKDHPRIVRTTWAVVGKAGSSAGDAQATDELRAATNVIALDDDDRRSSRQMVRPEAATETTAAACLFTSGSTGQPKGVLVGAADLMQRVAAEIAWFDLTTADVLLSILPFSFDVGLNQLMTALAVGAELVLLDSWLPADILRATERRKITGIAAVPSIWQDMINSGAHFETSAPHASLRYVTISGGSLPRSSLQRLPDVVGGAGIFKTYGQTEAFRATSLRPEDYARKLDSVGQPFPGVHIYVVREDGSRCPVDEVGEVVHTGLGVMMGYLGDSNGNAKLRANPFLGGDDRSPLAIFTGDMGCVDGEGYLYLKGRRDSMLKVLGNRVYPQEVTNQIMTIPGVAEAAVVAKPQADGQMRLVAFLTASRGVELSAATVRKTLTTKLPAFMIPKDFVFVSQMPRTTSGKVDERRLAEELAAVPDAMATRPHTLELKT